MLAFTTSAKASAVELVEDRQREALLVECRTRKIEPPGRTRIEKVLVAAQGRWEKAFCTRTVERLGDAGTARLLAGRGGKRGRHRPAGRAPLHQRLCRNSLRPVTRRPRSGTGEEFLKLSMAELIGDACCPH